MKAKQIKIKEKSAPMTRWELPTQLLSLMVVTMYFAISGTIGYAIDLGGFNNAKVHITVLWIVMLSPLYTYVTARWIKNKIKRALGK